MILEAEPLPPLHRQGVVAKVARAAGLRYEHLVGTLLRDLIDLPVAAPPRPAQPVTTIAAESAMLLQ